MSAPNGLAFYDLDGTLVSSNVVTQYAWYARHLPPRWRAALKYGRLLASVPLLIGLDLYSRRLFNQYFYREYRGMQERWLCNGAQTLFEEVFRPALYPGAKPLIDADRAQGYRTVLLTGSLDFAIEPLLRYFGFDDVICNSLTFHEGAATGSLVEPIIAGEEKVRALRRLCARYAVSPQQAKAYSDSVSDLPMLEAVGMPAAVNPERRLKRIAKARGWPILNLKQPES